MRFSGYKEREGKQYVAHLMYQVGIPFKIADKIGYNSKIFSILNEAHQNQNDETYNKAFNILQDIKGVGESRAKLYIEKYFENPYQSINWKMFEMLKKYKEVTKWTEKKMYDISRKIDDPSEIWDVHLNDDSITLPIAAEIYKITTKDDDQLKYETVQYFTQHMQLKVKQDEDNTLTVPKFMYNKYLNDKYGLFLEINDDIILSKTAIDYKTVYDFFNENKDEILELSMNDIETDDFASDQLMAFEKLKEKKTMLLTGFAGTGKTYMLDKYIKSLAGYGTYICSLAGKAVKNFVDALSEDSKMKTNHSTIAGLRYVKRYLDSFKYSRVCIVDEASMISMQDLAFLIRNVDKKSKLILIGDINQLPAINLDVLNWLTQDSLIEQVTLDIPKRQNSDSGIFKDSMSIIDYKKTSIIPEFNYDESQVRVGQISIRQIIQDNRDADIFLTTTNKIKDAINNYMSNEIRSKNDGHAIFDTVAYNKDIEFHEGEKIMIGSNNVDTGLMNGDIFLINYDGYLCDPITAEPITDIDNKKIKIGSKRKGGEVGFNSDVTIDVSAHKIQFAFAITTHKSQGSTLNVGATIMAPGPLANRNLLYTALTRFKKKHTLYIPDQSTLISALQTDVKWQRLNREEQSIIFYKINKMNEIEEEEIVDVFN